MLNFGASPGLGLLDPAHRILQRAAFAVFPRGAASGCNLPDDLALQAVRLVPCFDDVAVMREPIQRMLPGITPCGINRLPLMRQAGEYVLQTSIRIMTIQPRRQNQAHNRRYPFFIAQ